MSNINEFLEIILSLGSSASIDEIAYAYAKKYRMPISLVPKNIIASMLLNCKDDMRLNHATLKWELNNKTKADILYVSDNRFFSTIREK